MAHQHNVSLQGEKTQGSLKIIAVGFIAAVELAVKHYK